MLKPTSSSLSLIGLKPTYLSLSLLSIYSHSLVCRGHIEPYSRFVILSFPCFLSPTDNMKVTKITNLSDYFLAIFKYIRINGAKNEPCMLRINEFDLKFF